MFYFILLHKASVRRDIKSSFFCRVTVMICLDRSWKIHTIRRLSLNQVSFNRFENGVCHLAKETSQVFRFSVQRT